jgi:hypothetical protein
MVLLTAKVHGKALENGGKIVFHRYGEAYFLSEAWGADRGIGFKVSPSRAEKELIRKRSEMQIAALQISR